MITFKYFCESIDKAPVIDKRKNMVGKDQYKQYTNSDKEVNIHDLGLHRTKKEDFAEYNQRHRRRDKSLTKVKKIDLSKVHYTQPTVNVGKVKHFMKHYKDNGEHELPEVHRYPDGKLVTHEHHRLIAATLRGDKRTNARVTTWHKDGDGYIQGETE